MQPFRIEPNGRPSDYDTYGIVTPKSTHTRVGTCEEVDTRCTSRTVDEQGNVLWSCPEMHCGPHAHGWLTKVDVGTEPGQQRARYIIDHSGRRWTAEQNGGLVTFTFPAGQQCFAEHRVSLERDPLYTIRSGDWRSLGRPTAVSTEEWLNRFGENQANLAKIHQAQ